MIELLRYLDFLFFKHEYGLVLGFCIVVLCHVLRSLSLSQDSRN